MSAITSLLVRLVLVGLALLLLALVVLAASLAVFGTLVAARLTLNTNAIAANAPTRQVASTAERRPLLDPFDITPPVATG